MRDDAAHDGPVRLHIDELVLDGFSGLDGTALSEALRGELTRLIAEGGLGNLAGGRAADVAAEPVKAGATADATSLGASVAHSVYGGLKP